MYNARLTLKFISGGVLRIVWMVMTNDAKFWEVSEHVLNRIETSS